MARRELAHPAAGDLRALEGLRALPWLAGRVIEELRVLDGVDRCARRLAQAQGGVVGYWQLRELGMSRDAIRGRRERGVFEDIHRASVYGLGTISPRGRAIAALLAVPGSRVACTSYLALRGVGNDALLRPRVIVVGRGGRDHETVKIHTTRSLDANDIDTFQGLPATTVARALLDAAVHLDFDGLAKFVREAVVKRLASKDEIRDTMRRNRGHHGSPLLRRVLDGPDSEPTKAWAERELRRLLALTDLPQPESNCFVNGKERDTVFIDQRLIIELDTLATHGDPVTFESDRDRDNKMAMHDWETRRFTRTAVRDDPLRVLTTIAFRLGARTR